MKRNIQNAFRCFFTLIIVVAMSCVMPFTTVASDADDIFYDDFTESRLDTQQHDSYPDSGWANPYAELPKG